MAIDPDRILTKIACIREQVEAVERLVRTRAEDEILGDPWLLRGLKYALQTAIEAMIDIAFHVAAKEFSRAPADGREALNILAEGDIIKTIPDGFGEDATRLGTAGVRRLSPPPSSPYRQPP
ncbi:MAG: HepT-like ribonuclease domain-containing protein [Bacillota bacterium]